MASTPEISSLRYTFANSVVEGLSCGAPDQQDNVVLCLHGWLDNAASFLPLMPQLQKHQPDKFIVAIDWPGHGYSTHRSSDAHYHFVDWVYDLLQLVTLNGWQQVDIIGHSMGAMVASAFAAAFPEKTRSLTLIDAVGFISTEADKATQQLREGLLSRVKSRDKQRQITNKKFHPSLASAIKARLFVSDLKPQQAQLLVERGVLKTAQGYCWRSDFRLRDLSPYRFTLQQGQQFIAAIKCPVQLIYGSNGMDMVNSGLKHYQQLFKHFSSHELIGGHHVHMEQAEKTAELIGIFFMNSEH